MKRWLQITLVVEPILVASITDFAVGMIGAGVEVEEIDHARLKTVNIYVAEENLTAAAMDEIVAQVEKHVRELAEIFQVEMPQLSRQVFGEEDWAGNWKKHFTPFAIVPGLVIAPTWEEYRARKNEKVLVMDPGMAFGTGHHATTALVVELLMEEMQGATHTCVLDVGTGTGVLGMTAALLGAARVYGIDNDPVAVTVAAGNVVQNNLGGCMEVSEVPLAEIREHYSLVLANIVYDALISMAADLHRVTGSGGSLILSGLLQGEQVDSIRSKYEHVGFTFRQQRDRGEWAALLFRKA